MARTELESRRDAHTCPPVVLQLVIQNATLASSPEWRNGIRGGLKIHFGMRALMRKETHRCAISFTYNACRIFRPHDRAWSRAKSQSEVTPELTPITAWHSALSRAQNWAKSFSSGSCIFHPAKRGSQSKSPSTHLSSGTRPREVPAKRIST